MEESLYDLIVQRFCFAEFHFEDVRIEEPNGMFKSTKKDFDLMVFNSKKVIFFARLEDALSEKELICKLRSALSFLVAKFSLGLNNFIVCGTDREKYYFLNKYNDRLFSFDHSEPECFKILDHIENDLSYGADAFDYDKVRRLSDLLVFVPAARSFSKPKEKVRQDASGKTYVNIRGTWREASEIDIETLFPLTALGGMLGLHLFYQKRKLKGFSYLFTCGLFGIGWFFDCLEMLLGIYKDSSGKYLVPLKNKMRGVFMLPFGVVVIVIIGFIFKIVSQSFSDLLFSLI